LRCESFQKSREINKKKRKVGKPFGTLAKFCEIMKKLKIEIEKNFGIGYNGTNR